MLAKVDTVCYINFKLYKKGENNDRFNTNNNANYKFG